MPVVLCCLLLLLAALPARAQGGAVIIPRRLLFAERERLAVQLSPDGDRIGYLAPFEGSLQLWLIGTGKGDTARRVTDGERMIASWQWTFDNRMLLLARSDGRDRLLLCEPESGREQDLTPVADASLQIVGLSRSLPDQVIIAARTESGASAGLYRVGLDGSGSSMIAELEGFDQWYFDGMLRPRVARRQGWGEDTYFRFDEGEGWSEIASYRFPDSHVCGVVSLSADGRTLYMVDNRGLDKSALKAIDLESGSEKTLMEDSLSDIFWAGATVDTTGTPQAVVSFYVRANRHLLDSTLAADFRLLRGVQSGDVSFAGRSLDDRIWLIRYLDGGPLDYYIYDRAAKATHYLFSDLPALDSFTLAQRHPVVVPARDGLKLPCDLYLPAGSDADGDGRPDRALPTVVYVHGGPWIGFEWNIWLTNRCFQLLANRGYAVIRADFRGAAGYGRRFIDAGNRQWGEKMQHDLIDIAEWAGQMGIADRKRIAIWGWSYGGYSAFASLAFSPGTFACGISMYGLGNLESAIEDRLADGGEEAWSEWLLRIGDPRTEDGRRLLRRHSPINSVEQIRSPLLVTHGSRDMVVPQSQSDRIVEELRRHDHEVTYFVYPDEPHDYRAPESWESFWAIAERFLNKHLGGEYQPYGDEMERAHYTLIAGARFIPGLNDVIKNAD